MMGMYGLKGNIHFCVMNEQTVQALEAYSDRYPEFSGYIRYERVFKLDEGLTVAALSFEYVYECMELWIDEVNYGKCICPPYQYILPEGLCAGIHTIRIEVATTLDREQQIMPKPPFQYVFEAMEPTGMFGKVKLKGV